MTDLATLKQHQILTHLLALAREQAIALYEERLDEFLSIMERRERLVAELNAIIDHPAPANVLPFPTIAPTRSDPDVRAALKGLITSILCQDEDNERVLRAHLDAMSDALTRLNRGAAAGRGYGAVLARAGARRMMDRAG